MNGNGTIPFVANRGSWDGASVRVVKVFGDITAPVADEIPFAIQGRLRSPVPAVEPVVDEESGEILSEAVDAVETFHEEFHALGDPPAKALDAFRAAISYNGTGQKAVARLDVIEFLREILVPEDETRFEALLDDKNRLVPLRVMYEAAMALFTEIVKPRPTGT